MSSDSVGMMGKGKSATDAGDGDARCRVSRLAEPEPNSEPDIITSVSCGGGGEGGGERRGTGPGPTIRCQPEPEPELANAGGVPAPWVWPTPCIAPDYTFRLLRHDRKADTAWFEFELDAACLRLAMSGLLHERLGTEVRLGRLDGDILSVVAARVVPTALRFRHFSSHLQAGPTGSIAVIGVRGTQIRGEKPCTLAVQS